MSVSLSTNKRKLESLYTRFGHFLLRWDSIAPYGFNSFSVEARLLVIWRLKLESDITLLCNEQAW